jgi:shikimate kinase
MKIYLIGFMGCGKTTVGKRLAARCGFPFVDTDELFEAKHNCSIGKYFEQYGEDLFRKEEAVVLKETASLENAVIAVGGGTPCFYGNIDWMLSQGICIYLEMPPKALYNRLKNRFLQ